MRIAPLRALLLCWSLAFAQAPAPTAPAQAWPAVQEREVVLKDFRFEDGKSLPALRLHACTLGEPKRNAAGRTTNAVLILHGTGGSGRQFLQEIFAGQLFNPGQPLDASKYFLVLPDGIGHGKSSKPSDGLRAAFPAYTYNDMVRAQRLLLEQLGVNHLRLVMGTSMGGMHTWTWLQLYPEWLDAALPLACLPYPITGRNRMWRSWAMEAIRNDPAWKGGNYESQPPGVVAASVAWLMVGGSALNLQEQAPTREAADALAARAMKARLSGADANDMLYQLDASRFYDPRPGLETITCPVLAINTADDLINPPELGIFEREVKKAPRGRALLLPISAATRGHGSHTVAKLWKDELARLLAESEPGNGSAGNGRPQFEAGTSFTGLRDF